MATIRFVRIKADSTPEEFDRRLRQRRPGFPEVPGRIRKIYGRDPSTGAVRGIYFFESSQALAQFRESDLARTIAEAYEAVEVRHEVYDVIFPLRPEVGPLRESDTEPTQWHASLGESPSDDTAGHASGARSGAPPLHFSTEGAGRQKVNTSGPASGS